MQKDSQIQRESVLSQWHQLGDFLREKSYKKCLFFPLMAFDGQLDPYGASAALFSRWDSNP